MVRCSECGKVLGYNDMGNYHNCDGEPICSQCAATNRNGFICPRCGFKYPFEHLGSSGEYCVDCEIEYDD